MNSECLRIADQVRRAFRADAWHGPSLLDLLAEVTPEQARLRPVPRTHNIWELLTHIDFWLRAAIGATQGAPMPKLDGTPGIAPGDWTAAGDAGAIAWFDAQDCLFRNAEKLAQAIEGFDDAKLKTTVPGRSYDFYHLFHGIVQHSLYHAGQIAMQKKAMLAA